MINDIEILEKYILNDLSENDTTSVQNRIANDPPFAKLHDEIKTTIEVLKRKWLRQNIEAAKKEMIWQKVIKTGIIIFATLAAIFSIWFISKKEKITPKENSFQTLLIGRKNDTAIQNYTHINSLQRNLLPINNLLLENKDSSNNSIELMKVENYPITNKLLSDTFQNINSLNFFQPFGIDYVIDPTKNNIIGHYGVKIQIPANSLVYTNGNLVKKESIVSVSYFTNYSFMWHGLITTTSNGKLLQSGGSIQITGYCDSSKIDIVKNGSLNISFNSKYDPEMRTFMGERNSDNEVNWHPEPSIQIEKITENDILIEGDNLGLKDYRLSKEEFLYFLKPTVSSEGYCNNKFSYGILDLDSAQNIFSDFSKIRHKDIYKLYKAKKQIQFRFSVDDNGRINKYDYNFNNSKKFDAMLKFVADDVIKNSFIKVPKNCGTGQKIINVNLLPKLNIMKNSFEGDIDSANDKKGKIRDGISNINNIAASSFGYINCDKFINVPFKKKIIIHTPSKYTDVRIFFKNYNSVAKCYNIDTVSTFNNAPANEPILIVATLAKNNQLLQVLVEAKVGEEITLKDFKPYDYKVLEARLNSYH